MTNSTTTGLTAATTPLAGTELVPIVQTGSKKVTVANLTAGRAVQALSVTTTGTVKSGTTGTAGVLEIARSSDGLSASSLTMLANDLIVDNAAGDVIIKRGSVERIRATATGTSTAGNSTITAGNFIPATSGKGVDFSANAGATGMTSELLDWYEEGTWTPVLSPAGGTITPNASLTQGLYTRIGRQVTVTGLIYVTSVSSPTGLLTISGLPWASAADYGGRAAGAVAGTNLVVGAVDPIYLFMNGSASVAYIQKFVAGVFANMAPDVKADTSFQFSLTYMTT